MARPRQPIDLIQAKGKKHLTKAEIETRKNEEIKVPFNSNITPPTYLPDALHKEFEDVSQKLLVIGIMSDLDCDALAQYIIAKRNYITYTAMLMKKIVSVNKESKEYITVDNIEVLNKLQGLQDRAYKQCRSSAMDLGLTISSRCKLVVPKVPDAAPKINKFDRFRK